MGAVTRIIKSITVMTLVGLGLLLVSNIVHAQWTIAIIDVATAALVGCLYYALNRWPHLLGLVGALMAALTIIAPVSSFVVDPANTSAAMPIIAIGGVLVLSLLWPAVGLVVVAGETAALVLLTLLSPHVSIHTVVSFATVSVAIYVVSRWLSEALDRAERAQTDAEQRNAHLEQTLERLEHTVDQQRRHVETIRTLQTPLIESERGVGLLVVVGYCDGDRVQSIQSDLFGGLRQRSLHKLVVDVSGADFEVEGFDAFVRVLQALRLMIPDVVVSGMSSQLARVLTEDRERVRDLRRTVSFVHSLREALADRVVRL